MPHLSKTLFPNHLSKIGFHYFPDTLHYREKDLTTWLPRLSEMGAEWLVLQAPQGRAIPESFITNLIQAGIEPLLQFKLSLSNPPPPTELSTLFDVYARWGVHCIWLFEQPNTRSGWQSRNWIQHGLVERFLDRYIPLANTALQNGLVPVLPPLEPGGDYWDTAFLQSTIESLDRRKQTRMIDNLVLSALAWTGGHDLNWGAGGPTFWNQARPYAGSPEGQDHRGWRIYEWYQAIVYSRWQKESPMILLQAGIPGNPLQEIPIEFYQEQDQIIRHMVENLASKSPLAECVPDYVKAACFWLLAAPANSSFERQAFFGQDGTACPCVQVFKDISGQVHRCQVTPSKETRPIEHYLLLPAPQAAVPAWKMNLIQPFINKHHPTIGFSLEEASLAKRITVFADSQQISEGTLNSLRLAGSLVERIEADGISIATQISER